MTTQFIPPGPDGGRFVTTVGSPIGDLLLTGSETALAGLYMLDGPGTPPGAAAGRINDPRPFGKVIAQLRAYFAGELTDFDLPLSPSGTAFQLAVWSALTGIPYGTTRSYGEIARALGRPGAASRAVGAANGQNPIAVIVPCHRVIGADGSLTGYGGGLTRKQWLLRLEGAPAAAQPATLW